MTSSIKITQLLNDSSNLPKGPLALFTAVPYGTLGDYYAALKLAGILTDKGYDVRLQVFHMNVPEEHVTSYISELSKQQKGLKHLIQTIKGDMSLKPTIIYAGNDNLSLNPSSTFFYGI